MTLGTIVNMAGQLMFLVGLVGLVISIVLQFTRQRAEKNLAPPIALISIGLVLLGGFLALFVNSWQ